MVTALAELVESYLLTAETRDGRLTYRMLALVRAFAEHHLAEPGERERVRLAHAEWVQAVVARAAHDWVSGRGTIAGRDLERWGADLGGRPALVGRAGPTRPRGRDHRLGAALSTLAAEP